MSRGGTSLGGTDARRTIRALRAQVRTLLEQRDKIEAGAREAIEAAVEVGEAEARRLRADLSSARTRAEHFEGAARMGARTLTARGEQIGALVDRVREVERDLAAARAGAREAETKRATVAGVLDQCAGEGRALREAANAARRALRQIVEALQRTHDGPHAAAVVAAGTAIVALGVPMPSGDTLGDGCAS